MISGLCTWTDGGAIPGKGAPEGDQAWQEDYELVLSG